MGCASLAVSLAVALLVLHGAYGSQPSKKLANRPQKVDTVDSNRCSEKGKPPFEFTSGATACGNEASDEECAGLFPVKAEPNTKLFKGTPLPKPFAPPPSTPPTTPPYPPFDGMVIRDPAAKYTPANRSDLCNHPYFQDAAKKCMAQCFSCCDLPKYKCEDEVFTKTFTVALPPDVASGATAGMAKSVGPFSCSAQRETTCNIAEFRELMIYACPHACGLCDIRDARDRGKKASEAEAQLQAAKEKARQMQQPTKPPQMPRPRPRKTNCRDNPGKKDKWCYRRLHKCEDQNMWQNVQKHCPETCGECLPTNFRCKDLDARLCKQWNTKTASRPVPFCENDEYPLSAKLQHCAETCGVCPD